MPLEKLIPCKDILDLLTTISDDLNKILDTRLIGIYLFGSLSYGDFNIDSSDIDLVVIISKPLNHHELGQIKQMHRKLGEKYKKWKDRLECSYTPVEMLSSILPPKEPRPYFGNGIFYDEAPYGNEWIINNYLLALHGVALSGPEFRKIIKPIDILEVQYACVRDLFQEWEPKLNDIEWLGNSHYQSYLVLNLCRILYTVICGSTASKKTSAEWVKKNMSPEWINLIEAAEKWKYGDEINLQNETVSFIRFTVDKIKQTKIFQQMHSGFA